MNFKDKFKLGDIICSDRFHNGLCMVVDKLEVSPISNEFRYRCIDLVKEDQLWRAREFDSMFNKPYDWRIATDDDIANYLSKYLIISHEVGDYEVKVLDDSLAIEGFGCTVYLKANELIDLKHIIDERVG